MRRKDVVVAKTKENNGLYCKQKTEGYRKVCILSVFALTSVSFKKEKKNGGDPKMGMCVLVFSLLPVELSLSYNANSKLFLYNVL